MEGKPTAIFRAYLIKISWSICFAIFESKFSANHLYQPPNNCLTNYGKSCCPGISEHKIYETTKHEYKISTREETHLNTHS